MDPPEAQGRLGELERDKFLEEISREEEPDHWRRVLVHSLALHRETYLAAGGLPPRYGDFGAWVLAIELDGRGEHVAFSPRPRVRHVYDGDLGHIRAHLLTFGRGEIRFRNDVSEELAEPLSGSHRRVGREAGAHSKRRLASTSGCDRPAPSRHRATGSAPPRRRRSGPASLDPGRSGRRASGGAGCAVQARSGNANGSIQRLLAPDGPARAAGRPGRIGPRPRGSPDDRPHRPDRVACQAGRSDSTNPSQSRTVLQSDGPRPSP